MQSYEIRRLRPDGRPVVHASRYLGDFHAIRRALALKEEGEGVEVWRERQCIYRELPQAQAIAA